MRPLPLPPTEEDYRDILAVSCPECQAGAGHTCVRPDSMAAHYRLTGMTPELVQRMMLIPHYARVERWERDGKPTMKTRPQGQQQSWHETEEDWR